MINRLIKNEKDYEKALFRVEQLMDAEPGTAKMDELELLTALVKMYEDQHYPINPPDPIEAIKFRMDQLGLTRKDMVPYIGTKSKVSEILNGKRPLTLAMMRSLNKNLGISAEVLLKEPGAGFPNEMQELEWHRFPVVEMAKRCWIPKVDDVKEKAEELMRGFIAQAGGPEMVSVAFFRQGKGARYNSKMDPYALTAWCIRVLTLTRKNPLKNKYVKGSLKLSALQEVARLSYFENGSLLAREYLEKQGIHLIVVPHLPKTYLDGAAMLLPDGTPVIGMTLRHDRIDNFWFCLLHELAHVAKHLSTAKRIIVDDLDLRGHDPEIEDKIENEADEMTRNGLIPKKVWDKKPMGGKAIAAEVYALAKKLKIHPAIIAGRIRFEHNNFRLLSRYIGSKQVRKHFPESCSISVK
ncbi:MAG: transcriptional regulator [Deltaproteobacteria bacterium]|jgi:HTH-type transcriptional regulator/antitoxin HigA|nr:transcriptional regulator [Deltaproteobacteria bacterium]